MSVLFAALSALSYGAADFAGGRASRAHTVLAVLLLSQAVGLAGVALFSLILGQTMASPVDLAWGAAAGLSGLVGLGTLYRGLATGAAAIVSPTAALVGTAAPILAGVLLGETPTPLGWSGIALAVPAILLLSLTRRATERIDYPSLVLGIAAGIGFGGYFILIDRTSETSGFWPLVAARVVSIPVVVIIARTTARSLRLERHSRQPAVIAGVLDMAANVFFLIATRIGLLVTSAVISSLYPAPTVLLARAFDRQALGARRWVGLVLALVGLSLMAVG